MCTLAGLRAKLKNGLAKSKWTQNTIVYYRHKGQVSFYKQEYNI